MALWHSWRLRGKKRSDEIKIPYPRLAAGLLRLREFNRGKREGAQENL